MRSTKRSDLDSDRIRDMIRVRCTSMQCTHRRVCARDVGPKAGLMTEWVNVASSQGPREGLRTGSAARDGDSICNVLKLPPSHVLRVIPD